MELRALGFDIVVKRAGSVVDSRGSSWLRIHEPYTGAWQRNDEWTVDSVLANQAVYACVTLIANDIGKLGIKLVQQDKDGTWGETASPAFSPVLRKPNHFQNRIQFREWWITSKLLRGNTYVLQERDNRGVVVAQYILDPSRVKVLVAPDGAVFYQLAVDNLSGLTDSIEVPADDIIHDRMNCLFHPLVGVSPIYAAGAPASLAMKGQANSSKFFANDSTPSGILTAPTTITQQQATELAERWQAREKGKIAVLGNGLSFEQMRMSAEDAQMIEQLKWTAETICSTFHVPAFKVGAGSMPTYQNAQVLNQIYYTDCLQSLIEQFELCMDEGLGLGVDNKLESGKTLGVELDLDALLRMDSATQVSTLAAAVGGTLISPNEARKKMDLPPVKGGDAVLSQQQNFSVEALAQRDRDKPFAKPEPAAPALPPGQAPPLALPPGKDPEKSLSNDAALAFLRKELLAA